MPTRHYTASLEALRRAQKPAAGTAAYSRLVNRPLARRIAAAAYVAGLTPNQVTLVSALLSALGIVLLAILSPSVGLAVAVSISLVLAYLLDSADGQLARLRGGGSRSGEWLDHTIDCVKTATLHLAVAISWFRFPVFEGSGWLLIPLAFQVVAIVTYFGLILMPTLRPVPVAAPSPASENPWRKWLLLPVDYGVLCWSFLLLVFPPLFAFGYTLMGLAATAALGLALRKWWRELRTLDAAAGR